MRKDHSALRVLHNLVHRKAIFKMLILGRLPVFRTRIFCPLHILMAGVCILTESSCYPANKACSGTVPAQQTNEAQEKQHSEDAIAAAEKRLASIPEHQRELRIELLQELATLNEAADRVEAVLKVQQELSRLTEAVFGQQDYRAVSARMELSRVLTLAKQPPEVRSRYKSLRSEAEKLAFSTQYQEALTAVAALKQEAKSLFGTESTEYTFALTAEAYVLQESGKVAESEPVLDELLAIQERLIGKDHPDYAQSLNMAASVSRFRHDYRKTLQIRLDILPTAKAAFGEKSQIYLRCLSNTALAYENIGEFQKSMEIYQQAIQFQREAGPEQHQDLAVKLVNYGELLRKLARTRESVLLYEEAEEILRRDENAAASLAVCLNNVAVVYLDLGYPERSLPKIDESLEVRKSKFGEQSEEYASALTRRSEILEAMSDFTQAKSECEKALTIRRASQPDSADVAISLSRLGTLLRSTGESEQAEIPLREALSIRERVFTRDSFQYCLSAVDLGLVLASQGKLEEAEELFRHDLLFTEKSFGKQHPDYAISLANLGQVQFQRGEHEKALQLLQSAADTQASLLGKEHPSYLRTLGSLATVQMDAGKTTSAADLFQLVTTATRKRFVAQSVVLAERQQLSAMQRDRDYVDWFLTSLDPVSQNASRGCEETLAWKGLVTVLQREARVAGESDVIAAKLAELQIVVGQWSALLNAVPGDSIQAEIFEEKRNELFLQKERLEAELSALTSRFTRADIGLKQIQESLPPDTVLIDYFVWNRMASDRSNRGLKTTRNRSLTAFVISAQGAPVAVDLGRVDEILVALTSWRESFGAGADGLLAGQQLREAVWNPLLKHIEGKRTILISADGALGRLPFAALPGKDPGTFLLEDHRIVCFPIPQLLPALANQNGPAAVQKELLLIGGIDYGKSSPAAGTPESTPEKSKQKRPWEQGDAPSRGGIVWSELQETKQEVVSIRDLYQNSLGRPSDRIVDLRGLDASETNFRKFASQSLIIHVATHGFFAPEKFRSPLAASDPSLDNRQLFSPGQLSGLVLAGVNGVDKEGTRGLRDAPAKENRLSPEMIPDDGIITADEIASMPLQSVQLAVLSACETSLGQDAGSEGLLGLQRAFQISGVRTTIGTLWQVNDPATRRIMVEFYTNFLTRNMTVLDAMREAQLWALRNPDQVPRGAQRDPKLSAESNQLSPYYWAPFVISGDWR